MKSFASGPRRCHEQQLLVKTGGRLVRRARYHRRFPAEGHSNRLRGLDRIGLLPIMPGQIDVGKVGS